MQAVVKREGLLDHCENEIVSVKDHSLYLKGRNFCESRVRKPAKERRNFHESMNFSPIRGKLVKISFELNQVGRVNTYGKFMNFIQKKK